jgi:hypothetical protein
MDLPGVYIFLCFGSRLVKATFDAALRGSHFAQL